MRHAHSFDGLIPAELRALNRLLGTVTLCAETGHILHANTQILRMLGYELRELVGEAEAFLYHDDAPATLSGDYRDALHSGEAVERRVCWRRKDGDRLTFSLRACLVQTRGETRAEIVALIENVTSDMERRDSERSQARAIEQSAAIVHFAPDGTIIRANDRFLDLFGYAAGDIVGRPHAMLLDPATSEKETTLRFWAELQSGKAHSGEFLRLDAQGQPVWLLGTYCPVADDKGPCGTVVLYAHDLTQTRQRLADYEWQVAAIHRSQAVIEFDMRGIILDANDRFASAVGYSREELIGRHHRVLVDPAYAHGSQYAEFWQSLAAGTYQAGQFRRKAKDGSDVWLQASYNPVFDMLGNPVKIIKYATDITAEQARQAERQGQIAAIYNGQCVIEFDLHGIVLDANENFLAATGYKLGEILGRHHRMFVQGSDAESEEYRAFWSALAEGKEQAGEHRRLTKTGGDLWLQATYSPIMDARGRPFKIIKYAYDITREKLRQADYEWQIEAIRKSQGVMTLDLDGTIMDANDTILATLGYDREDLVGQHHSLLMDEGEAAGEDYREFWRQLREGHFLAGRFRRIGKTRSDIWLQASYNPIFGLDGRLVKIIKLASDVTSDVAMAEAYEDSQRLAQYDRTTSLPTRNRLLASLAGELEAGAELAVIYCDIAGFKQINDRVGWASGDRLLGSFADRLRRVLTSDQIVARSGSDEFIILAPGAGEREAEQLCHALRDAMAAPLSHASGDVVVDFNIGIALSPHDGESPDELIRKADVALSCAKSEGAGSVRFHAEETNDRVSRARQLTAGIRRGIDAREFFLEYQPRLDTATRQIRSAEALVRWANPERGRLAPGVFIDMAERTGLIIPLGAWIMREACLAASRWDRIGVSVNVSPVQFRDDGLLDIIHEALEESGLAPERLEIEITEGVLLEDGERALATLRAIKALGVRLAIDDFGTGYASLSYLRNYPFDVIKIDQQFIADIDTQEGGEAIVLAILALGGALGLSVTAEGVETEDQHAALVRIGCDEVQGYLFARPLSEAALLEMLETTG